MCAAIQEMLCERCMCVRVRERCEEEAFFRSWGEDKKKCFFFFSPRGALECAQGVFVIRSWGVILLGAGF